MLELHGRAMRRIEEAKPSIWRMAFSRLVDQIL